MKNDRADTANDESAIVGGRTFRNAYAAAQPPGTLRDPDQEAASPCRPWGEPVLILSRA